MKILAIALIVLGIVGLVYGGIGYNRQRTLFDVGGIKATATERQNIPIAPIAGGLALAGGIVLLVGTRRRSA